MLPIALYDCETLSRWNKNIDVGCLQMMLKDIFLDLYSFPDVRGTDT